MIKLEVGPDRVGRSMDDLLLPEGIATQRESSKSIRNCSKPYMVREIAQFRGWHIPDIR